MNLIHAQPKKVCFYAELSRENTIYIYDHKPMEPSGYKLLVSVLLFFVYIVCSLQTIWEYIT